MQQIRGISRVGERAWFVEGPASNWVVVRRVVDADVVLVDAGYPRDAPLVLGSLVASGVRWSQVRAVFLTHAHADHLGGVPALLEALPGLPVLCAAAEVAAVRGPAREQISVRSAGLRRLARPRFARWALRAVRAGGTRTLTIPTARAFTDADLADAGLAARPAPGHTPGSVVYEILGEDAVATGDAYVTDHPTYRRAVAGPIDPVFSADPAAARRSAETVSRTQALLPGHGPLRRGDRPPRT